MELSGEVVHDAGQNCALILDLLAGFVMSGA